ncbi:MAG: hypothetical protein QW544_02260, partial [Candidatus Caldarchaeum sp.]
MPAWNISYVEPGASPAEAARFIGSTAVPRWSIAVEAENVGTGTSTASATVPTLNIVAQYVTVAITVTVSSNSPT